ncbi:hypothetical protein J7J18_01520 [bacterium]|nr:hypothetical protein [bacterium]
MFNTIGARRVVIDTISLPDHVEVSVSYYIVNKEDYELVKESLDIVTKKVIEEQSELKAKAEFDDDSYRVTITTDVTSTEELLRVLASILAFTYLLTPRAQLFFISELANMCRMVSTLLSLLISGDLYDSSRDYGASKDPKTK